jgi:hypothetical protein
MATHWIILAAALAGIGADSAVDFDTEIIPVLTRAGCNTGECHGAAIGRGGFKLSLFGSDPAADYRAIVHELEGRRVNLARPDESLIVLKPTEWISHGGGVRLEAESEGVARLLAWIQSGAPRRQSRRLRTFIVEPAEAVVQLGEAIQLRALARFDDGVQSDVTPWTVFTPADPSSADRGAARSCRRSAEQFHR